MTVLLTANTSIMDIFQVFIELLFVLIRPGCHVNEVSIPPRVFFVRGRILKTAKTYLKRLKSIIPEFKVFVA
jgi:hypothetical protein